MAAVGGGLGFFAVTVLLTGAGLFAVTVFFFAGTAALGAVIARSINLRSVGSAFIRARMIGSAIMRACSSFISEELPEVTGAVVAPPEVGDMPGIEEWSIPGIELTAPGGATT